MDSIRIQGGMALQGKVRVQGSKNASLPILAATLLVREESLIRNCPRIADVYSMVSLLKSLGCGVHWQETGIAVDSSQVCICPRWSRWAWSSWRKRAASGRFLTGSTGRLSVCRSLLWGLPRISPWQG